MDDMSYTWILKQFNYSVFFVNIGEGPLLAFDFLPRELHYWMNKNKAELHFGR
jgi:hypothetical protein